MAADTRPPSADGPATENPYVTRVVEALEAAGATGRVVELTDSTRTAAEAATALGCPVGAIANSLVFAMTRTDDPDSPPEPLLVLTSGAHRVDTARVAELLGVAAVRRADPDLVRRSTGFAIGGVAPIGHPAPLRTLVDTALADHEVVWAAAGSAHSVFPTTFDELVRISGGLPAEIGGR